MKHLTVIWAMLVLALACFPCMDGGKAFAMSNTMTVQADDQYYGSAHSDAHEGELCSPLCDCNCCGGIKVTLLAPLLQEPQHSEQGVYLSTYREPGVANPSFPFWHPPRV